MKVAMSGVTRMVRRMIGRKMEVRNTMARSMMETIAIVTTRAETDTIGTSMKEMDTATMRVTGKNPVLGTPQQQRKRAGLRNLRSQRL
jgi:hypothetical protein